MGPNMHHMGPVDGYSETEPIPSFHLIDFCSINDTQSPVDFLWLSSSISVLLSVCSPYFALFCEEVDSTVPPLACVKGFCTTAKAIDQASRP